MVTMTKNIVIAAPPEQVFDIVDDPAHLPEIWRNLSNIRNVQPLPNGGNSFQFDYTMAGIRVEQVFHSGKARAQETASLLAETLRVAGRPQARPGLNPNDPVKTLGAEIGAWSADTLVVGHLPFLGRLASLLLASDPERPLLAFEPGSRACLERDGAGHWVLLWMIRPDLLGPAAD